MSALIFVALAVAWAVYLVPKALRHHDEGASSRSVEGFSDAMRVLARREPVDERSARLVVTPGGPASTAVASASPAPAELTPAQRRARREAANRAARRRRRVLSAILVANALVVALAAFALFSWWYVAIPAAVLVAWLVACRVMVRQERGITRRQAPSASAPLGGPAVPTAPGAVDPADAELTQDVPVVAEEIEVRSDVRVDPALWDPVPVTLPTYVSKPAAARTVRTIDLDGTGVWTSGHTEADSQLAREAEQAERDARRADGDDQRAVGS